jgi:hypothetical protein
MPEIVYCIDSSSLIGMKDRCPDDIFPGVWEHLSKLVLAGRLIAPAEVKKEVEQGSDPGLLRWIRKHKLMFRKLDVEQVRAAKQVIDTYPNLIDSSKEKADADPFLIALAITHNNRHAEALLPREYVVVTEEGGKQFKIPYVCRHLNIKCMRYLELFRAENWKFGE